MFWVALGPPFFSLSVSYHLPVSVSLSLLVFQDRRDIARPPRLQGSCHGSDVRPGQSLTCIFLSVKSYLPCKFALRMNTSAYLDALPHKCSAYDHHHCSASPF